jgi:hypothetical protein
MSDDQMRGSVVVPETLLAWLQDQATAAAFVSALKAGERRLSETDLDAAAMLVARDVTLATRAAEFLKVAEGGPPALRNAALQFGQKLLGGEFRALQGWLRDESSTAEEDLRSLASALAPGLRSKDAKIRRQTELSMSIGLKVFFAKRRLQPDTILDVVAEAYGLARAETPSDGRPARAVGALVAKSKPRQLLQYAAVARLIEQKVERAKVDEQRERARAVQATTDATELRTKLSASQEANARLEARVKDLEDQLSQALSRMKGIETVGAHDVAGLRARYRRVLGEDVRTLAGNAQDALEIEPPRPDFAKLYLADILSKVEGEIDWLSERSD